MNFVAAVRCFTQIILALDEKAIEQQAILFSHAIRFHSTRSHVMVVFSQRGTCDKFYNSVLHAFIYQLKVTFLSFRVAEKCTTQRTISGWQDD